MESYHQVDGRKLILIYYWLIDFSLACFFLSIVFLGCQNHLVVQDGGTHDASRRCERPPYPTLLTNTNNTRRFSVCSALASREVISCSPEMRNSRYFENGQWKKMWELEPRQTESSKSSLEKELIKVISMVCFSLHSLYMIYVLVTKTLIEAVIRIKLRWAIVALPRRYADSLVFFSFLAKFENFKMERIFSLYTCKLSSTFRDFEFQRSTSPQTSWRLSSSKD